MIFLVLAFLGFIVSLFDDNTQTTETSSPEPEAVSEPVPEEIGYAVLPNGDKFQEYEFRALCQVSIKDQLIAPATAKFPGPFSGEYPSVRLVDNVWLGQFPVDSQNAFGALIRTNFNCKYDATLDQLFVVPLE